MTDASPSYALKTAADVPMSPYPQQAAYPPQAGYPPQAAYPPQAGYPPAGYPPQYPPSPYGAPYYPPPAAAASPTTTTTAINFAGGGGGGKCAEGHSIKESFTMCGIVWAILCFPIGLACCLTMKDRRCVRCGGTF